ncbi:hypothetical protein [Sphingobacterium multivorum]|uniref:hypothetical protein n=1 Tax=Sphingobacterium multivorum TaxID=28454 RepID=UPI0036D1BD1D
MKPLISLLILTLAFASSCKKSDDKPIEKNLIQFDIHSDQPISSLTVIDKRDNKIIFPKTSIKVVKNYYDKSGNQIFQYSENIKVNTGDRIEFQIPAKTDRKIFKVAIYENKFFDGFYEENGNQVKVFVVPDKL